MEKHEMGLSRKKEIEDGFLELMGKMRYEDVTVKDLTEKLGISRKTFYHYFPGKHACLESLTDRLIWECSLSLIRSLPENAPSRQIHAHRLNFWKAHKNFLDVIIRDEMGAFFLDRYLIFLKREDKEIQDSLSTPEVEYDGDILFFYMSGMLFLLLRWCHEGFPLTTEEMAQKYIRLTQEPLLRQKESME